MRDFFKWTPESGLEPWFETDPNHRKNLIPISPEGHRALWILVAGMASVIPLVMLLALAESHYPVVLVVILLAEFGTPLWFLWRIRGRITEMPKTLAGTRDLNTKRPATTSDAEHGGQI